MQKWEYLVVDWNQIYAAKLDKVQDYINGLGENGWELVSVTAFHNTRGAAGNILTDMYSKLIFKRPRP